MKSIQLQILFSLCIFIASESTENIAIETAEKPQTESEAATIVDDTERQLGGKRRVTAPTKSHYTTPPPHVRARPPRRSNPPNWKGKFPFYDKKYQGLDSYEGHPAARHTHTIIFQHGFTGHGKHIAGFVNKNLSKHARVVGPSSPVYHIQELHGWVKWYHTNEKWDAHYHSWSKPGDYINTVTASVRRIWDLIEKEAKLLNGNYKRIFLVGHSQGADLAIQTGVSFNKTLGGIIALQNWAWGPAWLGKNKANARTPILTIQGRKDRIVTVQDATSRMNDPFWQSNRKPHVRLETWYHLGHLFNHNVMNRVNNWISHRVK